MGVSGDTQSSRFTISNSGVLGWGDGTNTNDATLSRLSANALQSDSYFRIARNATTDPGFAITTFSAAQTRFVMLADGGMTWGDGTNVRDTSLYRKSADILATDDSLFLANQSAAPGTPSGGGVIYVESGSLKFKGSSGTVTTLGVA
jgi:hypothetical protein